MADAVARLCTFVQVFYYIFVYAGKQQLCYAWKLAVHWIVRGKTVPAL